MEVWDCGVDRFSQHERKCDSLVPLTSARSPSLRLLCSEQRKMCVCLNHLSGDAPAERIRQRVGVSCSSHHLLHAVTASPSTLMISLPPCPLIETNTNIIPTGGGNSSLTWMIKILLKPLIMTSCGMRSKCNYHCWCKHFPRILFWLHRP